MIANKKRREGDFSRDKIQQKYNVLEGARQRICYLFDNFNHFYVSFSGGKDSGVLLNLTIQEAKKRGRLPVDVLIVDFEAQYHETHAFIERMVLDGEINPYWVCLPLSLRNSISQFQPKWLCWDPAKEAQWVRDRPPHKGVISNPDVFPFFQNGMEFEDFVFKFAHWYQKERGEPIAVLIGIRADESLHRFNT
ncbi:phosphoadenosine phosphosulfate reductase family protein, partial [Vibrio sp. 10N.222.45.F7]